MSLITSFSVGVSGLHSSQTGLNTTAHNLANAKTEGYTRQQNINADTTYLTHRETERGKLQVGLGTQVAKIRQIRDLFLDREYRYEVSCQTFYESLSESEKEIEDVLGEMEGVEFQNSLNDIWNTIQDLSTNPESIVNRQLFISQAESFVETSKNVYKALTDYQTGLNSKIEEQVKKINQISDKIAGYNTRIAQIEASGAESANDLRDERNLLLDELAKYTYYTYNESNNGQVNVLIQNAPLVLEGISYHMDCEKINPSTHMYKPVWRDNGCGDVYDLESAYSTPKKTDTGSLLGILTARGSDNANYTDMPISPKREDYATQTDYDAAVGKYKDEVEKFNNTTGNSILTLVEAQFDQLIHGITTMMNDAFAPNIEESGSLLSTAALAPSSSYTFDTTKNYKILDVINCPVGTDDEQTIGEELFKRTGHDRYTVLTLTAQISKTDASGNQIPLAKDNGDGTFSLYVYNEEEQSDVTNQYTITNLQVNPDILANYSLLPVKKNSISGDSGAYDQDIYRNLLSNWRSDFAMLDPNTLTTYTYDEYYSEMVGKAGTLGNVWDGKVANQTKLVEETEGKRQQISGVSTEEELVNLLMYQHAYNAASRYINTVDQMLQHLVERLG